RDDSIRSVIEGCYSVGVLFACTVQIAAIFEKSTGQNTPGHPTCPVPNHPPPCLAYRLRDLLVFFTLSVLVEREHIVVEAGDYQVVTHATRITSPRVTAFQLPHSIR